MRPRTLKLASAAGTVIACGLSAAVVASDPKPEAAPLKPAVAATSTAAPAGLAIPPSCSSPRRVPRHASQPAYGRTSPPCGTPSGPPGGSITPSISDAPASAAPDVSSYVS